MDGFRLLRVKAPGIFPVKCFSVHVVTPSESYQISETLFNRFYHKLPGITIGAAQKRTLRPEAGGFVLDNIQLPQGIQKRLCVL